MTPREPAARHGIAAPGAVWEAATVFATALILAHQGGWDEMLLVAAPVGIFAGLLWIANRRADGADQNDQDDQDGDRLDDHGHHGGQRRPSPES